MHRLPSGTFFFFNDTATTEIYTLSLHDALPICRSSMKSVAGYEIRFGLTALTALESDCKVEVSPEIISRKRFPKQSVRSEEHTSELQSQSNLVCRLLLEKKNSTATRLSSGNDPP